MIFIGILLSIAAIGFLCWLLFTLAVFALPFIAGVTAGTWAYGTGAGWLGAIVAGFHATHGIVKHTMPSETWQTVFSVIGAIAVGIVAFVRITGMAASDPSAGHVSHA